MQLGSLERRLFLVGAGGSLPAPANLPLFDTLRRVLCEWMGVDTEIGRRLPPEVFMNCVAKGLGQKRLSDWLVEALGPTETSGSGRDDSPKPNAVHAVLGYALTRGHLVWSLNVDELIEQTVKDNDPGVNVTGSGGLMAHRGDPTSLHERALLMKPHGTLTERDFIFRTDQVIRPLPAKWASRLDEDLAAADEVVFIGYRGADVDLRVPLDAALGRHRPRILWFSRASDTEDAKKEKNLGWKDACRYLPALSGLDTDVRIDPNPSADFLAWAVEHELAEWVNRPQLDAIGDIHQRHVDPPRGSARLARGLLLELLNEVALAEDVFVAEMLRGRHLRTSAVRYLKLRWYAGDRRLDPLKSLDRSGMLRPIPYVGRRLRRADLMYLSSVTGQHDTALDLAGRSDESDPATWIVIAKAKRNAGSCESALRAAREASRLAALPEHAKETPASDEAKGPPSRADEKAHAVFEEVFSLIWLGRYREARQILATLYDGYDAQARIRWIGWAKYLEAGLRLLNGKGQDAASELESARSFFEADDNDGRRRAACDVLILAAYRIFPDVEKASKTAGELWIPSSNEANIMELAAAREFEMAEAAREMSGRDGEDRDQQADLSERRYRSALDSTRRPLLACAAKLGLAEVETTPAHDAETLVNEASDLARHCGFRRLLADAVVTSYRRGLSGREEALNRLGDYQDMLPGWDSGVPDVEGFLDQHHRIVCVW